MNEIPSVKNLLFKLTTSEIGTPASPVTLILNTTSNMSPNSRGTCSKRSIVQ